MSPLEVLKPLKGIKPLTTIKIEIVKNISAMQMLLLSSEILLQCRYAMDNGSYDNGLMTRRIFWANKLIRGSDDMDKLYFNSDVKAICKALKIKNPL